MVWLCFSTENLGQTATFGALRAQSPVKHERFGTPSCLEIIEPSWPLLGGLGALGGSWTVLGGSWASLGLPLGPPEAAQSVVKHEGLTSSTKSGPGPRWRSRFEFRCVYTVWGPLGLESDGLAEVLG